MLNSSSFLRREHLTRTSTQRQKREAEADQDDQMRFAKKIAQNVAQPMFLNINASLLPLEKVAIR
jgi:hypothetical protein